MAISRSNMAKQITTPGGKSAGAKSAAKKKTSSKRVSWKKGK